MAPAIAQNLDNYLVNNGLGNPASAQVDPQNANRVILNFSQSFADGQSNSLQVSNLTDFSGNVLNPNPSTLSFTYFVPVVAAFRNVVINEILADPSPVVALPELEFVELYNRSNRPVNLSNWTLSGGTIGSFVLAPQAYVILCASTDVATFATLGDAVGVSSWNTLTNTGETITLRSPENTLIDELSYNLSWYRNSQKDDGGYALEQINPDLPCSSADNWMASGAPAGGTPGSQNSIFDDSPDQTAPRLVLASVSNPGTVQLRFSEAMDQVSLQNVANYAADQGLSISGAFAVGPDFSAADINLSPEITPGTPYQLTVSNLLDCSGNALPTQQVLIALGFAPAYHELVISEIMADPSGNSAPLNGLPEAEFLEIFNRSDRLLDLKDCSLIDNSEEAIRLPQLVLPPNAYVILCAPEDVPQFQSFGTVLGVENFPDLTNGGELLVLRNPADALIFAVEYSSAWYQNSSKSDGGWTLEMIDTGNPCGEGANWLAADNEQGGTPGQANSVAASRPDLTAPRLSRVEAVDAQTLVLTFNEPMDPTSLENARYSINQGISVEEVLPQSPRFRSVRLRINPALQAQTTYTLLLENAQDCSGNLMGEENELDFGLPETADSADILLSEVLFNPRSGGSDFVELYNNSDKFINLRDWKLANFEDGIVANQEPVSEDNYVLPPQSFVVLSSDIEQVLAQYPMGRLETFLEMAALPSYADELKAQ
ncbi:MAG: hypothetical protein HC880_16870 [Bacteroidia bacterium]|nr:hypothetical protein [Bacteroidia bacterium]